MSSVRLLGLLVINLLLCIQQGVSVCYFSVEYTGVYVTQSIVSGGTDIHYLDVTILPDSIPVWGFCHRRLGNKVLLSDVTGGTMCVRCFYLEVRSPHILEAHTEGLDKCYTNEATALATCPSPRDIAARNTREIMLYKKHGLSEDTPLDPVYCPINGRFLFTYNRNDGTESVSECPEHSSRIANCPRGNSITLSFNKCSFADFDKSFGCLGDWEGNDGQRYLALHDPEAGEASSSSSSSFSTAVTSQDPPRPQYRCAMYKLEEGTGRMFMSLSSDSTCLNNLHSAWEGFETLVLNPEPAPPPAPQVARAGGCRFPDWAQGQWEHVNVDNNLLSYTDLATYKTFNVYCLAPTNTELVPVYAQSQCGEETFACLAIQERSSNVMEFQLGDATQIGLHSAGHDVRMCESPSSLSWDDWVTQGRVDRFKQSPCPVAGEYTGVIPDATMLCAKLYSDCNNPEIMFYTVFSCYNRSEVFEEREYRCLGQWSETGVTYTYTERRDVSGYECFAGVVVDDGEIYIIEAGTNCQRGLKPASYGMKLNKQAACLNDPGYPRRPNTPTPTKPSWWNTTKNPWNKKPIPSSTSKPKWKDDPKSSSSTIANIDQSTFILSIIITWNLWFIWSMLNK